MQKWSFETSGYSTPFDLALAIVRRSMAAQLVGMLVYGSSSLLAAGDALPWPQWRGPNRDGSVNAGSWPDSLQQPSLKERWRIELPPSYSGPVVSTDKVFVTYTRDEKYEGVRALDRNSGEQIWEAEWEGAMQVAALGSSMGSWIRATPTYGSSQ